MNTVWHILARIVAGLLVAATALLVGLWYRPLIHTNERLRRELNDWQDRVAVARQHVAQKSNDVQLLTADDRTLERLIREKLGWARPGETVILFEAAPAAPAKP
jgi:cell division protein FtsB